MGTLSDIGRRLAEERIAHEMTQTQAADIAGVTRKTVFGYESGQRAPDGAALAAWAGAGFDALYILTGQKAPAGSSQMHAFMLGETARREPDGKGPLHDLMNAALQGEAEQYARRMPRIDPIIQRLATCTDEDFALIESLLARFFGDTKSAPGKPTRKKD
jgi:transcriptional regulator with XRE-family HTH domain